MRILHVIPGLTRERGGPTAVIEALVRCQARAGQQVAVLTTDQGARYGETPADLDPAVYTLRVPVSGSDRLAYAPGFRRLLRAHVPGCDVVHLHSIFTYPIHAGLREAGRAGVPAVMRPCGQLCRYSLNHSRWPKQAYLALWGRQVRRACTAWHFTSAQESAESWPWDASPRFILPNGIDPEGFAVDREQARQAAWQAHPQLAGSPYVLFLGRLHPKKRLDLLIEAFLDGAAPPFKLVVAGPDEAGLWPGIAARLLQGWRAEKVVRVGTVAGPAKVALLAGAALFALPSEHENFGIAALEALAAGTPVLLSPHVDLAESALAAGLGNTAPLQVEAWSASLATLLGGNTWSAGDSARARAWVRDHYSWEGIASRLTQHYERVVSSSLRAPRSLSIPAAMRRGRCPTSPL
jgi:glycosyltransferase involved in cell wall biosynthesis